jgi:hypothetical protein
MLVDSLNKLTLTILEYTDKNYNLMTDSLNYLGIVLNKLYLKDPSIFFDDEVHNSLLNLADILIEKGIFLTRNNA